MRARRRAFALPGGSHDRVVGFLGKALPAGVGVLAALMLVTPLGPRGELSFLLDRNEVALTPDRLRVDAALYRGLDDRGRPFSLRAGKAVQRSAETPLVEMDDLEARILLEGGPAQLATRSGAYNIDDRTVRVPGVVSMEAADGYRMRADNVTIDLAAQELVGSGGVSGAVPAGSFSADSVRVDLPARRVILDGNARLTMIPGKLRTP